MTKQLKELDAKHVAELQKEKDEVFRLKAQLEELSREKKAGIEKVLAASKQEIGEIKERLEGEAQKYKDLLKEAEENDELAQRVAHELKG